jgi:hypothetical protein
MKTLILFIVTVAVGCATHAQPKATIAFAPSSDEDVLVIAQAPEGLPAPASVPKPPSAPKPPKALALRAEPGWGLPFGKGSRNSRTLVIPQGEFSLEKLGEAEEDLNVMALILEKAVEQRSDDKRAMGIDLLTSSSSGIKNLLIEGHGAIFFLKTKIALLPPPTPKKEETKTKESSTTSEWDEARQQLYGPSDIERHVQNAVRHATMSFSSSEEYDKDKVQRLKDSLTDALKSASNIRHLKGDQTVTVVVTTSNSSMYVHEVRSVIEETRRAEGRGGEGGRGGGRIYVKDVPEDRVENRSASRLLLQAKKSDIDSFAKGKLTSDAFRDKVKIQIY